MPRTAPNPAAASSRALGAVLPYAAATLALIASTALVHHPAALLGLLLANACAMAVVSARIGAPWEPLPGVGAVRAVLAHTALLAGYTVAVGLLVGAPLRWLLHAPSLQVTLALSAATVFALLLLWRAWPVFALVFLPPGGTAAESGPPALVTLLRRRLALAHQLSGEHELFFSHGLPVSLALLVASFGALVLADAVAPLPDSLRPLGLCAYAVYVPLAQWLVANRCRRAMLLDDAAARPAPAPVTAFAAPSTPRFLPSGLAQDELDAALLAAARLGDVELALAALDQGASPDTLPAPDQRDQRSVLVLAALLPEVRLLRALIARRVDVNRRHNGLTALLAATRDSHSGRPDAVLTLLTNGADTALADADGNTALHHAARAADPSIAAMLLDAGASPQAINREGFTPLGVAAAAGNWPLVRFLLEHGARPDVDHAIPALLAAAGVAEDDVDGVRLLLKHRARCDARGPMDRTALMAAALAGHRGIVKALLDAGADPNLVDRHGTTALMEAARSGAAEVIRAIAARKPDPRLRDAAGRTALVIACQSRASTPDSLKALLALGGGAGDDASAGLRAIDVAAKAGRWDLVAALDPTHPLPAPVAELARGQPLPGADSPAHLLDALRFGHWNVAEDFRQALRLWPAEERAEVLHGLGEAEQHAARDWVVAAGVDPDICLASGERVLDAWLSLLPVTTAACLHLLHAGASAGGAGRVRRVLEAAREAPAHHSILLHLASEWLQRGGDPFAANAAGETALHLAAQLGASDLLRDLLQRGVDPTVRDRRGATPLHAAVALPGAAAAAAARLLIAAGADPLAAAINGETPLGLALARGEPSLLAWLQWRGWPLPGRRLRDTDLIAATVAGDAEAVRKLLQLGLAVDAVDAQGATALLRACGLGHVEVLRALLAAGADAAFAAPTGATALSAAVSARRVAAVEALLQHGVDVNHRLPGGGTALMIAAALGFPDIIEPLLQAGADPTLADEEGTTALHAAAQFAFGHTDTLRARAVLSHLCRAGAAVNARNAQRQTALLLALGARAEPGARCVPNHLGAMATLLLDHGADLNAQDERGVSPLHACAIHGLLDAARLLLARGADRDAPDRLGRSAGDIALLLGYTELAQQLGRAAPVPSLAQILRRPAPGQD